MNPSQSLSIVCLVLSGCLAPETSSSPIPEGFTRQDQLRGSITPERGWWDLVHYDLELAVDPDAKRLAGSNEITFVTVQDGDRMQVDLQPPLEVTRVTHAGEELTFEREGNVYWLQFPRELRAGEQGSVKVDFEGKPTESENPPWSGGLSWDTDELDRPFIATTCHGIGASIWWPNKDHGADEPDRGMDLRVTVPEALTAVCNGRLVDEKHDGDARTKTFHWRVVNPINNYGVNLNIGHYMVMRESYEGEGGTLDLEYWVLDHQEEVAREHFKELPRTLAAFEHWFGKYPFYEDSFKLVVVPYLGMEHQSSVTYGNGFQNGYSGRDLSKTGVGMKFDFIIIHESAHEWWGNSISMKDAADMWIHESFANYAENLFVDYHFGSEEAADYVIGCRALIQNDRPIIGTYGLNSVGSLDMYYKGGNMLHTMRTIVNDDEQWRDVLRGLNADFWHQTVTTEAFEARVSELAGFEFELFFDQYLRTTQIPVVVYETRGESVFVHLENVVPGLRLPVKLAIDGDEQRVMVSEQPTVITTKAEVTSVELDRNYYMTLEGR